MSMFKHFDAVNIRHLDIGDDEIVERAVNFVLGGLAGVHGVDSVSLAAQGNVEHFADGALIVANQDVSHAASPLPQPLQGWRAQPSALLVQPSSERCEYWRAVLRRACRLRLFLRRVAVAA